MWGPSDVPEVALLSPMAMKQDVIDKRYDGNGTIIVVGGSKVAEYNASGQLLTTFGTAGIMTTGMNQITGLTTLGLIALTHRAWHHPRIKLS